MTTVGASKILAGRHLIDIFPSLKYVPAWFPGGGFQREAAEHRKMVERVKEEPVRATETDLVRPDFRPSYGLHEY
jgi:hypothetical protein